MSKKTGKDIDCKECKKTYYVSGSKLKRGSKFCSRMCLIASMSRLTGPLARNWKGGLPKCVDCEVIISRYSKRCDYHSRKIKSGKNHYKWKVEGIGYRGIHSWIEKALGKPNKCLVCGIEDIGRRYHWANISKQYKRDVGDWMRLCVPCHKKYDMSREHVYAKK